jgi:hypothetical protein
MPSRRFEKPSNAVTETTEDTESTEKIRERIAERIMMIVDC